MTEQVLGSAATVVVGRFIDAVSAMDVGAITAVLHPEIVVIEPAGLPYGGVYRGRDTFLTTLLPAIAGAFTLEVEEPKIFDGGDSAACRMIAVFTSRRTGTVIRMPYVEVYDVVDGLIAKADVFPQDVSALARWMEANR